MTLQFSKSTFKSLLHELTLTKNWFSEIGLNISGTRFEQLFIHLDQMTQRFEQGTLKEWVSQNGSEVAVVTLTEAIPFTLIFKAFNASRGNLPINALNKAIAGSFLPRHEDAITNASRNHLFELELAARLKLHGVEVKSFDDVGFIFKNHQFNLQCKRPLGKSSVEKNIKRAKEQLSRRLNNLPAESNPRGIIAIAAEKIMSADKAILKFDTGKDLESFINEKLTLFVHKHSHLWLSTLDSRIIACIVFLKYVVDVKESDVYSLGTQIFFCPIAHSLFQASDFELVSNLAEIMKKDFQ